jgi:epsilon-lactone hydrolase
MASEQLKKVIDIARSQQPSSASEPTIEQLRTGMEKVAERVTSDLHCKSTIAGNVKAEWVVPPGADSERVLLYFHGGGYVMGSINTHRAMVARMARAARAQALLIDYRLAPEHPFPGGRRRCSGRIQMASGSGVQAAKNRSCRRFCRWRSHACDVARAA